jgi:hypothetical protein
MPVPTPRLALTLFAVLLASPPSLAGGGSVPQTALTQPLNRTSTGQGFTLRYPGAYTVRPFAGGLALVGLGQGDVLTATVLTRPGQSRSLSPDTYARQFAPLNIQGAGALTEFTQLRTLDGTVFYRGTWRAQGGNTPLLGPLYLMPLGPGAQRWLVLSAVDGAHEPLLDAVARHLHLTP